MVRTLTRNVNSVYQDREKGSWRQRERERERKIKGVDKNDYQVMFVRRRLEAMRFSSYRRGIKAEN